MAPPFSCTYNDVMRHDIVIHTLQSTSVAMGQINEEGNTYHDTIHPGSHRASSNNRLVGAKAKRKIE